MDIEQLKSLIRDTVDCVCCPIDEDAVNKVASFLTEGLGYTEEELRPNDDDLLNEIDLLYHFQVWTYEPDVVKSHRES